MLKSLAITDFLPPDTEWPAVPMVSMPLGDDCTALANCEDGNLLAISRNITSSQLPISLMTELKKNYRGYWISDLFEMVMSNETSYYITLENGDQKLVLKSHSGVSWDVYKKEKKDAQ